MSDFARKHTQWLEGGDVSTSHEYPDHPRMCDTYACDEEADCPCNLCTPPSHDRYCEACCIDLTKEIAAGAA
jgi:hypothetical protein